MLSTDALTHATGRLSSLVIGQGIAVGEQEVTAVQDLALVDSMGAAAAGLVG